MSNYTRSLIFISQFCFRKIRQSSSDVVVWSSTFWRADGLQCREMSRNVDQLNSVRNGALWKQRVECCQVREHADSKQVVAGELQRRKRPISGTVEYD